MNKHLIDIQQRLGISEDVCEILEKIGVIITSEYGQDCHNYNLVGSPIDIELIESEIFKIRDTDFLKEKGYPKTLVVSKDTIYEWASIIVSFWEECPEY